jgi:hypothetical protein
VPPRPRARERVGGWRAVLDGTDVAAQRNVLAALVEQVVARRGRHGRYTVEITWTPLGDALRGVCGQEHVAA